MSVGNAAFLASTDYSESQHAADVYANAERFDQPGPMKCGDAERTQLDLQGVVPCRYCVY